MLSLVSDLTRLGLHHQHQGPELTLGAGQGAGHGRDLNIELSDAGNRCGVRDTSSSVTITTKEWKVRLKIEINFISFHRFDSHARERCGGMIRQI